jgi:hypothetical protein
MVNDMIERIRGAIKDSDVAGPNHGVVLSKVDAKRVLYRLIKENEEWANRNLTPASTR